MTFTFVAPAASPRDSTTGCSRLFPRSMFSATTSYPRSTVSHLIAVVVSSPPEYARTSFGTNPSWCESTESIARVAGAGYLHLLARRLLAQHHAGRGARNQHRRLDDHDADREPVADSAGDDKRQQRQPHRQCCYRSEDHR